MQALQHQQTEAPARATHTSSEQASLMQAAQAALVQAQIEELQTKLAFQELTVEELNQEVIKLNRLVAHQQHQIQLLVGKLQAMEPSNIATQAEETPPPHY